MAMEEEEEERTIQRAARARLYEFSCKALLRLAHAPADKDALDNILFRRTSPSFSLLMDPADIALVLSQTYISC